MLELISLPIAVADVYAAPNAFGIEDFVWVSLSMLVLFAIFLWKKVPGMIVGGLDKRIEQIKQQLDEAKELRAEAEQLRDQYAARIASAEKDAEAMMDSARREADTILEKAESDSQSMIERRQRMAEEKISAAEREAIEDVRAKAADAAALASRRLIAERHDREADRQLADEVIASI
ncbi:MAG: hypothetical protein WA936_10385 [Erythrobacter sp.]|uniref:F0F1 ATP synthase subunit B family protein n=1 Tax=Erythrobacter sp. TaxID=1042 RepID=UPI003C72FA59